MDQTHFTIDSIFLPPLPRTKEECSLLPNSKDFKITSHSEKDSFKEDKDENYFIETPTKALKMLCLVKKSNKVHYEKCNVFTHVVGTLVVALLLIFTILLRPKGSDLAVVSRIGGAAGIYTFLISAGFHTFRSVKNPRWIGKLFYSLDQIGILISIVANSYADIFIWTLHFFSPLTYDVIIASALVFIGLIVSHLTMDSKFLKYENCSLQLLRFFHVDATAYSSLSVCLFLSQCLQFSPCQILSKIIQTRLFKF